MSDQLAGTGAVEARAARRRMRIMGILNVTPDSFSDGGLFNQAEDAVEHAYAMAQAGADIIDVGGESTRPGHAAIDADTELYRVLPVLRGILPDIGVPVSIDTYKAAVAETALGLGASIVNDVWGLQRDPQIADVVAAHDVEVIVMHNREAADGSIDIIEDMLAFFDRSLAIARRAGISDARIVLDPGIGFGKTFEQSLAAVKHLDRIRALGFPVLLGLSRKSVIGRILNVPAPERGIGTLAMNAYAMGRGAIHILRVHDVAEHVAARAVFETLDEA